MSRLEKAMQQAQERKELVARGAGANEVHSAYGLVFSDGDFQDRAVFSGFDLDYGELVSTSCNVGDELCRASTVIGLRSLFIAAWCDGLLTGMLLASLPPDPSVPGDTEATGPGGFDA